jgi:hypothetical protein
VVRLGRRGRTIHQHHDAPKVSQHGGESGGRLFVTDPESPYRYLEVRGTVENIEPDTNGSFFLELADRYHADMTEPPADVADRVVFLVLPTAVSRQ